MDEAPAPSPIPVEDCEAGTAPKAIPAGFSEVESDAGPMPPPIPVEKLPPRSVTGRDLAAAVLIIWAAEFALGFAVGAFGGLTHTGINPAAFFAAMILSGGVTVLICWSRVCKKYGKSFNDGFAIRPVSRGTLLVSFLIGAGCAALAAFLVITFGNNKSLIMNQDAGLVALGLGMALAVTLPPIEEIYYRGFIFPVVRKGLGATAAVILVTLWFTVAHWLQFVGEWMTIPIILAVGAIFALQRLLTGSLIPSIVTHWTYNATLVAIVLATEISSRA